MGSGKVLVVLSGGERRPNRRRVEMLLLLWYCEWLCVGRVASYLSREDFVAAETWDGGLSDLSDGWMVNCTENKKHVDAVWLGRHQKCLDSLSRRIVGSAKGMWRILMKNRYKVIMKHVMFKVLSCIPLRWNKGNVAAFFFFCIIFVFTYCSWFISNHVQWSELIPSSGFMS